MKPRLIFSLLWALSSGFAQTSAILTSAGYSAPSSFQFAAGQVVTLFVRGVPPAADGTLRSGEFAAIPLPAALAGISVRITQSQGPPLLAPLFAVHQVNDCGQSAASDPTCLLTSVRMQVPFEVSGELQLVDSNHAVYAPPGLIAIDVDGQAGRGFSFQPVPDNVHTITTCDLAQDTRSSSICNRQLFHADGSIVDENSPARPGEGVAVYVYGLGPTQPSAPSGAYPPGGAAVTDILGRPRIGVSFQSGILNALNSSPRSTDQNRPPDSLPVAVISAGLFFGQIGIYQINFAVPAEIPLPYPCGNGIHTNSVFRIITSQGSEEIALCVRQ